VDFIKIFAMTVKEILRRFLRHVPVVYVDYPGETSLKQIYGTFNRAMLRMIPNLRAYADPLTNAMVEFYLLSQVSVFFGLAGAEISITMRLPLIYFSNFQKQQDLKNLIFYLLKIL
jgi:hypothetical protein